MPTCWAVTWASAIAPFGPECGHLFTFTPTRCTGGMADPYVEIGWSRYFGMRRPSRFPDAYPVAATII